MLLLGCSNSFYRTATALIPLLPALTAKALLFALTPSRFVARLPPFVTTPQFQFQLAMTASTTSSTNISPPIARREEDRVVYAGVAPPGWDPKVPRKEEGADYPLMDPPVPVPDPYGWMRDDKRENKEVLEHLEKENEYTMKVVQYLEPLRDQIYQELVSSIQETDYTTPRPGFNGEYVYYSRTFEGKSYSQHVRAPSASMVSAASISWDGSKETPILEGEQVLLDVNELAEGKKYCSTGSVKTSPSQTQLAYSVDFTGGETYGVWIKNLETGDVEDLKLETSGGLVWGKDDSTLFYMTMDSNHRPDKLFRRRLDQPGSSDQLLHEENDDMFYSYIFKSLDGKYLFMKSSSKETSEVWFLDLEDPEAKMQCVAPRRNKVLYSVNHRHGSWWISTNQDQSPNMKLMICDAKADCASEWKLVTTADGKPLFEGGFEPSLGSVSVFDSHVVMSGREDSIPRVWVYDPENQKLERLEFDEPAHDVGLSSNSIFETDFIAITFDSMVTPPQTMLVSLKDPNGERTVLKAKNVPNYDKELYACERTTVLSRDGKAEIPVSLVYRKDVMEQNIKDGKTLPVHLYGYGSYGSSIEADFRSSRLPLLNRGYVYVISHVRGGGEKGRPWYEAPNGAKFDCKKNTFNDFVDCARWLIDDRKLTTPGQLSCEGRSAGGLLIGASINQAPELFRCAVLGVPFVDIVCTMIDASIPLTALEWVEWGNPNSEKYFKYMMEYSPVNSIKEGAKYPACWLTGGLHDPRVPFWEPAKLAACLRHGASPDSGPICVKMDMAAGHFSASDRYKYLKELALDYSFMLDQMGLTQG